MIRILLSHLPDFRGCFGNRTVREAVNSCCGDALRQWRSIALLLGGSYVADRIWIRTAVAAIERLDVR